MKAVKQFKVILSAFTYLDEHFDLARLIISSPFFICTLLNPKAAGREETFLHSLLTITLSLSQLFPSTRPPLVAGFPYLCHYHTLLAHSHLFPISLLLLPCFMHKRLLAHMSHSLC